MTQDRMQLSELLEKAGADDIVREMIGFVAQRLMELDVNNRCGASHGCRRALNFDHPCALNFDQG